MAHRDEGWALSDKIRFGEILVRAGVLERSLLENLVRERDATGVDLGDLLVARGIIDEATMLQTIGKSLNRPVVGLDGTRPDPRALGLLSPELCREHLVFPVEIESSKTGDHLHVAMANPLDVRAIKVVMQQARLRIQPLVASAREIKAAIARHYAAAPATIAARPSIAPPSALPVSPLFAAATPPPTPAPPLAPAPQRPLTSTPASSEAVFDFAVMDLSSYDAQPEPPPPTAGLFGAQPPTPPPAMQPSPASAAPRFGLGALSSPGLVPAPADLDLARLLDKSANEALMATAEMSRSALPLPLPLPLPAAPPPVAGPPGPQLGPTVTDTTPGFSVVAPRRRPSLDAGPPDAPSLSGLASLPPLPGRVPTPSASPPPAPSPPVAPHRPLPPLPPALHQSRPGGDSGRPAGHRDSSPSLPPIGRVVETPPPRQSDAPGGALPVGVIDHEDPADLRHILERYTQALGETRQPSDELIARFIERFGAGPPPREAEALFDALARSVERQGPGLGGLVLALVQHLARRGLVDLPELVRALGQNQVNQNDADRRP